MIDFSPGLRSQHEPEPPLVSPTSPRSPPMSPPLLGRRRSTETGTVRRASMSELRGSQARLARTPASKEVTSTEATIRGVSQAYFCKDPIDQAVLFPFLEPRAIPGTVFDSCSEP
jgi:hypothetical protein